MLEYRAHNVATPPATVLAPTVGQRYVFTGMLRDDVQLSMTFQAQAPAPAKPAAR